MTDYSQSGGANFDDRVLDIMAAMLRIDSAELDTGGARRNYHDFTLDAFWSAFGDTSNAEPTSNDKRSAFVSGFKKYRNDIVTAYRREQAVSAALEKFVPESG